ncbi:unnamed protein product [Heterobilharzia americana]|nr:unnamed protein product [Heterobilharzia americana]
MVTCKPSTPSNDVIAQPSASNVQSDINRSSDQDSGLSSQLSGIFQGTDVESQNGEFLHPLDPLGLASTASWTTTLRCTLFNRNPVEGINYLIRNYILVSDPVKIAEFLLNESNLNRQAIGEYFGILDNSLATEVLKEFLLLIDMKDMEVDVALRSVIGHFHPSGESQKSLI